MPPPKRNRRERPDEWASIQRWTLWPEQELYEAIRPLVLFHETAGERAKEIDVPRRTLARKADEFEQDGMQSLFSSGEQGGARETGKSLPEETRQLIVSLHAELPSMSWREIAEVCYIRTGRRPDHKSVKRIATSGLSPSRKNRRYQPWHQISSPTERRLAVVRLHSEGWSITWCQQLPQSVDRRRQKLFLPPPFHTACRRFCTIPAGQGKRCCPREHGVWIVPPLDQQEPHHFERVCSFAYGPELDHRGCSPQPSPG